MARVIIVSTHFPKYHKRAGQETFFREKMWAGFADIFDDFKIPKEITDWDWYSYYNAIPKWHTIRKGYRWKVGDKFSPRMWSGKPYHSKQIIIGPDVEVKKVFDIEIAIGLGGIKINGDWYFEMYDDLLKKIATNDGLSVKDFNSWFGNTASFEGQIICWSDKIDY